MEKGLFIVLEGLDGSGKSTQKELLMEYLMAILPDKDIVGIREPGSTVLGEKIRTLILTNKMEHYTRALLYAASRWELSKQIDLWLKEGKIVVCDRYFYSSLAYQTENDEDITEVLSINRFEHGLVIPDYVLHFDISIDTYLDRKYKRQQERELDELEKESDAFFKKCMRQYKNAYSFLDDCFYNQDYGKIITINANKSIDEVANETRKEIDKIIREEL